MVTRIVAGLAAAFFSINAVAGELRCAHLFGLHAT